jgi:ribosomal protein L4
MSDHKSTEEPDVLLSALEYLLDVRQSQLAEALSDSAHRGDIHWTQQLRFEVDKTSRFLQALRGRMEQSVLPFEHQNDKKGAEQ